MDKRFYLMRKNEIITLIQFEDNGNMIAYSRDFSEESMRLAPLAYRSQPNEWLYKWWNDRSIPLSRDQIKEYLAGQGLSTPGQYLVKNLGLSLTDYYWIKPVDSNLTWEKVNLYDNAFHDDVFLSAKRAEPDGVKQYSPNASLQGNIEKTWTISDDKRCLIKGNHSASSAESINELIASEIHKRQGYSNYTDYKLIHIKGKPYKYGCISEAFTSQHAELLSAWSVITSEKKDDNTSLYEHFIAVCVKHGINEEQLRNDLEYQILCDYILTGYDRHMNNISVIRDADTLKFIRMAPIYDSGDCLFANKELPGNIKELQKMEITSFTKHESDQIKLVRNRNAVDLNKLPSAEYIKEMYHKDDRISDKHINAIAEWYERKIDILDGWQHG